MDMTYRVTIVSTLPFLESQSILVGVDQHHSRGYRNRGRRGPGRARRGVARPGGAPIPVASAVVLIDADENRLGFEEREGADDGDPVRHVHG
ncbi:MAG: hypothetical protein ACM3US_16745, partial [Sphingomonadaceae bacterium]